MRTSADVCHSCITAPGTQGNASGVEIATDGLGVDAELAADGGAGLAGEVTPLGLTFLLIVQTARPTGDTTGFAEIAELLLADAIALADLAHRYALLVQSDHVVLLRWRKAGVMLAQALRRGSGYGGRSGCSGSVVGRQRPGELQQRLPVLGDGGKEGHHKLRIRTLGPCGSPPIIQRRQNE